MTFQSVSDPKRGEPQQNMENHITGSFVVYLYILDLVLSRKKEIVTDF